MEEKDIKENMDEVQEDKRPYQTKIEDARKALYDSYSKQRTFSNVMMFVVLGAIVGVMFMIMNNNQVLKIVGYCLAGALLVGMILYYVLTRKKFPNKTREYILFVGNLLRERQFGDQYKDVKYDAEERFELTDFAGDGVYTNATNIQSRNIVRVDYKGHHVTYGEVSLVRPSTRKQQVPPLFVGKYVTLPNDMDFSGRFIFVLKNAKQPYDLPNNIEDLVVLEEKDDFVVYGPEGSDYHETFKGNFVANLKKIKVVDHLFNVNIVVWGGHSAAYLSYDDAIMAIPFDKPFDYQAFEQSIADVDAVIKLLAGE